MNNKIFEHSDKTIEQFLNNYARKMPHPEFYYGVDTGQQKAKDFNKDNLNVLMVCLSDGTERAISSTFNAVSHISRQYDRDKIFFDFCYYPEDISKKLLIENNVPWMFGNATHRPFYDFDIVAITLAVLPELYHLPTLLKNSGIPYTSQQRYKDDRIPLIILGGASASESSVILGDIKDSEGNVLGNSLCDWVLYGYGEGVLEPLMEKLLKLKQSGFNLRDKSALEELFIAEKVLYRKIFYTQRYKWHYKEDNFTIKEIECLDNRLPKTVDFNRMVGEVPYAYTEKFYDMAGYNPDGKDLMISYGCTGQSSSCSFSVVGETKIPTERGLLPIKDLVGLRVLRTERYHKDDRTNYITDFFEVKPSGKLYTITLSNGMKTTIDEQHLCQRIDYDNLVDETVRAYELKVGDYFQIKIGSELISQTHPNDEISWDMFFLMGLINSPYTKKNTDCFEYEVKIPNSHIFRIKHRLEFLNYKYVFIPIDEKYSSLIFKPDKNIVFDIDSIPNVVFTAGYREMRLYLAGLLIPSLAVNNEKIEFVSDKWGFISDLQKLFLINGYNVHIIDNGDNNYRLAFYDGSAGLINLDFLSSGYLKSDGKSYIPFNTIASKIVNFNNIKFECEDAVITKDNKLFISFYGLLELKEKNIIKLPRIYEVISDFRYITATIEKIEINEAPEGTILYSTNSSPYHRTCYDLIYSHNCSEGTSAGYYIDRPLEKLKEDMKVSQKEFPVNSIHFHAFNLNYYYRFQDLIYEASKHFARICLQNERMDIIAYSEEQVETAKFFGLNRMSLAIEGVSDRIRNKFLNKNLPNDTLFRAMDILYKQKMMHMKCVTGDTLVLTFNRGYVPAKYIQLDDILIDGNGNKVKILSIYKNPAEPVMELETKYGLKIKGQRSHKVKIRNSYGSVRWCELQELISAYRVNVLPTRVCYQYNVSNYNDIVDKFPRFVDMLYNDLDAFRLLSLIHLSDCDIDKFSIYDKLGLMKELKSLVDRVLSQNQINYYSMELNSKIDFTINDKEFIEFIKYIGVKSDAFYSIVKSSTDLMGEFVKVLFASYGYKNIHSTGVSNFRYLGVWYPTKTFNIKIIREILLTLGYLSSYDEKNKRLSINPEQLLDFLTNYSLVSIEQMLTDDELAILKRPVKYVLPLEYQKIVSIRELEEPEVTYAIQTETGSLITNGIVSHNCGIILTGYETDEDYKEFEDILNKFKELKLKHGASTSFQVNVTPLIHYNHVAICYLPRKMAVANFNGVKTAQKIFDAVKNSIGGRVKINAKGYGNYAEQLLIDIGPAGTNLLVKLSERGVTYEHMMSPSVKDKIVECLKEEGYDDPLFFTYERPDDWIFPNDHIDNITMFNKERYKQFKKTLDCGVSMCLETQANSKPKCHGCTSCPSSKDIRNMVRRDIRNDTTIQDFIDGASDSKCLQVVRFVCTVKGNYDILHKKSLSFAVFKEFTRLSDNISGNFLRVGENSHSWNGDYGAKAYFSGQFWFNVQFRHIVPESEFTSLIEQVNQNLESVRVDKIIIDTNYSKRRVKDFDISYIGFTDKYSYSFLKSKFENFEGEMKVAYRKRGGGNIEVQHVGEYIKKSFLISHNGDKVYFHLSLPSTLNPYLLMSTFTRKSELETFNQFRFKVIDTYISADANCKCGRTMSYSLNKGEYNNQCSYCSAKTILYKFCRK